ncbi:MAG: nucleoside kinase, partial [Chloroflexota bacterium]
MPRKISLTPPSPTVQLHLPDGRALSGPRGANVGEFLKVVEDDFDAPIVAAIVNGELHELTYPIEMESRLQPVAMDTADGARIYRRSLIFLLEMAFADLFPEGKLTIDHSVSSGGFFCQLSGRPD